MYQLKKLLKKFVSQQFINNFYHLPKAVLANVLSGFPTKKLIVVGVTGTDGKTTTTNMIYQILKEAGKKVSMVSSIDAVVAGKTYDIGFHVTSPDPFMIQKFARQAVKYGDDYLVLEVTSHGLDQFRFWGIKFEVGVITNITHEHLDYHKNFENYKHSKLNLLKETKFAIINQSLSQVDVQSYKILDKEKVLTFGLNNGDFNQKDVKLKLKLIGNYNIENALAALAVAFVLRLDKKIAQRALENFANLAGRMEEVKNRRGIRIVIDFAHTPNGLEQSLIALRSYFSPVRLIVVFGAASERDILKRPMMGKISASLADITILTDEDPRFEDRNKIIDSIAQGALKAGAIEGINLFKKPNRQEAIKLALLLAKKGDIIGIFGKGHEKSVSYMGEELPWSDREAVKKALHGR